MSERETATGAPVVLGRVFALWEGMGLPPLTDMEGARWILDVPSSDGAKWVIGAVAEEQRLEPKGCMQVEAIVGEFYIWWNGWLAGILHASGGTLAAHPEGASEDRLIADLERMLKALTK